MSDVCYWKGQEHGVMLLCYVDYGMDTRGFAKYTYHLVE